MILKEIHGVPLSLLLKKRKICVKNKQKIYSDAVFEKVRILTTMLEKSTYSRFSLYFGKGNVEIVLG